MKVEFLSKFNRDLEKIRVRHAKVSVSRIILLVESASHLSEIPNLKKLSGHKSAYRIKVGNYRIGICVEGNVVEFARVVHRKDIYKVFP